MTNCMTNTSGNALGVVHCRFMSTAKKAPKKRAKVKTAADRVRIVEREAMEHGYKVKFYAIEGRSPDGQRIRQRFKTLEAAEAELMVLRVKLQNEEVDLRHVVTKLTPEQQEEAETCTARLLGRYSLTEAVDYFLRHYCEPDLAVTLAAALRAFLDDKERDGVRERSLRQLRSTLGKFVRLVDPEEGERLAGEKIHVHEIGSVEVEGFLSGLKARDGKAKASRKTWNNYRGDLHLFFGWCAESGRRWISDNPVREVKKLKLEREAPEALSDEDCQELMSYVATYKEGAMSRYFALALFAGIRPGPGGELHKLADRPRLIDSKRGWINVKGEVSKTSKGRRVKIQPCLAKWLKAFPGPILPANHDRMVKHVRQKFALSHDVLRHTFISMHLSEFKSYYDTAREAGNSEGIIRQHYEDHRTPEEAEVFWKIAPEA